MTSSNTGDRTKVEELPLALERDLFLRSLIRELAGTLQDVVGVREASGYISVVGARIVQDRLEPPARQLREARRGLLQPRARWRDCLRVVLRR